MEDNFQYCNSDQIRLRDEMYSEILNYLSGSRDVAWIFNLKSIYSSLYKDTIEDEKDFLSKIIADKRIETWLTAPSTQKYFNSPNFMYEKAKTVLIKYLRGYCISAITYKNGHLEKVKEAEIANSRVKRESSNNDCIKYPRLFEEICEVEGIRFPEKMSKVLADVYGKGMLVSEACKEHHMHYQTYANYLKIIKEDKERVRKLMRNYGFFIVEELEKENEWSAEMMEERYGTKPFPYCEGYLEQFNPGDDAYKPSGRCLGKMKDHFKTDPNPFLWG